MKLKKYISSSCVLSVFAVSAWATDYTATVTANGSAVTLQDGDTINTSGTDRAIDVLNGGSVTVTNPLTDSVQISGANGVFVAATGGSVNLGNGSSISTTIGSAISIAGAASSFNAGQITLNLGTSTTPMANTAVISGISATSGSSVEIGNNSTLNAYGDIDDTFGVYGLYSYQANTKILLGDNFTLNTQNMHHGIYARTGGTMTIGSGANLSGNSSSHFILSTGGSSKLTFGDNLTMNVSNAANGINASTSGEVDLGKNANINVTTSNISNNIGVGAAVYVLTGGKLRAEDATIVNTGGEGVKMGAGGTIDLINTNVTAATSAISILTSSGSVNPVGVMNIIGGNYNSIGGDAIGYLGADANVANSIINISDGAVVTSNNGVFFDTTKSAQTSSYSTTINVTGAGTRVEGVIIEDDVSNTTVSISDRATWISAGSSKVDTLILDGANIELTLTTQGDAITADNMTTSGMNDIIIDFSNDFLNEIMDGFMFDTDTAIIIGSGEKDNINYIIAESNKDGSTWDITDNLDGRYTITNINVVPEPATYAAIFGALALAVAVYRRRK